jgi:hypothetical protein
MFGGDAFAAEWWDQGGLGSVDAKFLLGDASYSVRARMWLGEEPTRSKSGSVRTHQG